MLPEKFDITFAIKAICLTDRLNGTDKRVALAILDHYNRRTGRCDPSRSTIGELLHITPRTVSRSLGRIAKANLFAVRRHGGHNNCNSYQPKWKIYRELEQVWKQRRRFHSGRFARQELSSSGGQPCHLPDDQAVSQTSSTNIIPSTSSLTPRSDTEDADTRKKLGNGSDDPIRTSRFPLRPPPASEAARNSAERRWNRDLFQKFGRDGALYGMISDAIDRDLQSATTAAELKSPSSGLSFLLRKLAERGIMIG
jgi:hypothetical protein